MIANKTSYWPIIYFFRFTQFHYRLLDICFAFHFFVCIAIVNSDSKKKCAHITQGTSNIGRVPSDSENIRHYNYNIIYFHMNNFLRCYSLFHALLAISYRIIYAWLNQITLRLIREDKRIGLNVSICGLTYIAKNHWKFTKPID